MATLAEVQEVLSDIPAINRGGCGVAAIAIKRTLGNRASYYFMYWNKWSYYNNRELISSNGHGGATLNAPTHVAVRYHGQFIDCNGTGANDGFPYYHMVTEEELLDCLNNTDTWNSAFSREEWIPVIEQKLKIDLSDVYRYYDEYLGGWVDLPVTEGEYDEDD